MGLIEGSAQLLAHKELPFPRPECYPRTQAQPGPGVAVRVTNE